MNIPKISVLSYTKNSVQNNKSTQKWHIVQNNCQESASLLPAHTYGLSSVPNVSFGGLMRFGDNGAPIDSAFFRDYEALEKTGEILKTNFPDGAEILDYACSDGEEAISLYALLGNDRNKFKITGIDVDKDAIRLANQGVYSLFGNYLDSYLMPNANRNDNEQRLSDMFYEIMEPANEPDELLNTSPNFITTIAVAEPKLRGPIYFQPKEEVKRNLEFKMGDICKINEENTDKKVGAIIFRNAFYHLLDNHDGEEVFIGDLHSITPEVLDEDFFDEDEMENIFSEFDSKTLNEKQKIADEVVDKIYDRLEVGGVFAVGAAANEHIFIAPDDTPDDETIRFGDTAAYKKQLKAMEDTLLYYENAENYSKLANAFNNSDFKQYMPNQEEM